MQKKKKYYEIKDGGVTLYWDMTANMLVDIDVQPGVKTVNLFVEKTASQYLYSIYRIMLDKVYKQFPDVEELHIGDDISTVKIRNDMFPNVKLVTSENDRFVDGASMLIEITHNMERKLLNTFYMQSNMELDLKNIKYIDDYALNGCLAHAAINCDSLNNAGPKAFCGAFMFDSGDDGLSVINDVVLKVEPDAKSVRLSKRIRRIANSADFKNVKELHVESINILNQMLNRNNISGITDLFIEETSALDIRKLQRMLTARGFDKLGNIHVDNKYYTSIDGIIYSRDKQTLVLASSGRNGVVNIPEGTKTIANGAFMKSNVCEVNCPDSLEYIKDNAFYACSFLKKVNFGKGLKQIGDSFRNSSGVFAYCYVLNDVVIPSSVEEIGNFAFFHCDELSNVTFNEGIRGIGLSSFSFCPKLTDVVLPASLIEAGLESFQGVLNITVKDGYRVFNLPSAVMMLPGFNSQEDAMNKESLIVDVNIEGKGHVYLPKYTSSDKITYTNDFFNSNWYDKEFSESVYEQAYSSRSKQILAIHIYKQTKSSDVEAYLRRAGKTIAKRMIDEGNESGAVEFLQFGLMTTAALKTILKTAEAKGAASVSSYILMQLSNKKKSTFRL